jgi:hypothetical protein
MVAGVAGTGKGEMALTARETDTKVILFGNFVFWDYARILELEVARLDRR